MLGQLGEIDLFKNETHVACLGAKHLRLFRLHASAN
jgi:hypothetical protein